MVKQLQGLQFRQPGLQFLLFKGAEQTPGGLGWQGRVEQERNRGLQTAEVPAALQQGHQQAQSGRVQRVLLKHRPEGPQRRQIAALLLADTRQQQPDVSPAGLLGQGLTQERFCHGQLAPAHGQPGFTQGHHGAAGGQIAQLIELQFGLQPETGFTGLAQGRQLIALGGVRDQSG